MKGVERIAQGVRRGRQDAGAERRVRRMQSAGILPWKGASRGLQALEALSGPRSRCRAGAQRSQEGARDHEAESHIVTVIGIIVFSDFSLV